MAHETRITTCCYCGARGALVLTGKTAHHLSCASCGAPITELKQMPRTRPEPMPKEPRKTRDYDRKPPKKYKKTKKKRGSTLRWMMEEAWDVIEDVFD